MAWAEFTIDSLIDNWGRNVEVSKNNNDGELDETGIYIQPEEIWFEDFAIFCVMTNNVLMPSEPGVYTAEDMYYITRTNLEIGNWLRYKGIKYRLHERADFSFFNQTDIYIYKVKSSERMDNSDVGR